MKTAEVRDAFLTFFAERDHRIVSSSSLVPQDDPTLLFTNAGMNQFKDPLLGRSDPGYKRAVSSQRCVRAGGKHNDLENVGYTARHHTFFEMLGNFSFGDYFKEETISWAWEFVTEVLELPPEKIWVTVHPTDDDARDIWLNKIGIPQERVIDLEENFWTMGDTGPCGPCTELFFDHGPDVEGGPPGSPEEDGDRYIEFWNLVFPQFDRSADGTLSPLPQPGVDTGMGLERVAAIMQDVHSNYEIDMFRKIMQKAGSFAGINRVDDVLANPSLRVVADHIRSSAFLIADGIMPGNEDRDYVLRRIIRRGLRHGHKLGITNPFFHRLVGTLVEEMGEAFPNLVEQQSHVEKVLLAEEQRFGETLNQGMALLDQKMAAISDNTLPGDVVFQLYDTFGFPADLTADIGRERGINVDMDGFEIAMEAQRERGRAAAAFSTNLGQRVSVKQDVEFLGYSENTGDAKVLGTFNTDGDSVEVLNAGEQGVIVLDRTPFYAESGGQVGDRGQLLGEGFEFKVEDTLVSGVQSMHIGSVIIGSTQAGSDLTGEIDDSHRDNIRRNHSATHLLHAALRQVLGSHVQQKGSLVNAEKLRFDFSHSNPLSTEELAQIEALVNEQILLNSTVTTELLDYEAAVEQGAMALFGEKYADQVRVLTMGSGYSVELCGGTHVAQTGDIGSFYITQESGIAAGVRRIEAVSGAGATNLARSWSSDLNAVAALVKTAPAEVTTKVEGLLQDNRSLQKEIDALTQKLASSQSADIVSDIEVINGVSFLAALVDGDNKALMQTLDTLKSQLQSYVLVLTQDSGGKVNMVVAVSEDVIKKLPAADIMAEAGASVGVRGGGRPDLARGGGGNNPAGMQDAFLKARSIVAERLS
jgi:alanyl-tRNA synthetase